MDLSLFYFGALLLAIYAIWLLFKRPRKTQKRISTLKPNADTLDNEDSEGDGLMGEGDIFFPSEDDSEDD